jgi:hypothetical protein
MENYYCVDGKTGELWILGSHGDFDAADATATDMGLAPVWILTEKAAEQWRSRLQNAKQIGETCYNFSLVDAEGNLYMGTSVDQPDPTIDREFWEEFLTGKFTLEYCGFEEEKA